MRKFKNTKTNEIAEQINDDCWYSIKTDYGKYQLPIWCLTEMNEWTGKNPWIEIKQINK